MKLPLALAALALGVACGPHRTPEPAAPRLSAALRRSAAPLPGLPASRPAAPASRLSAAARLHLTILTTNDFHGQLDPIRRYTDEPTPRIYRVGGAEALAATIEDLRAADPSGTLLVDGGDFMQGSLLANRFEGAPVRELFNLLRYDAAAVGNHEFDYGPVGVPDPPLEGNLDPRGALREWIAKAGFPVLSANLRKSDGGPLEWKNLHPTALIRRRGVTLGLIGLTTPETAITTMPAYAQGLRFEEWLPTVQREARALRSRGAQIVVLVAHGAAECRRHDTSTCHGYLFTAVLDRLDPGLVDLVVAGHSHVPIAHSYRGVLVVEACSRGQLVGRLDLVLDSKTKRVLASESRALPPVHVCHDVFKKTGDCAEQVGDPGPIVPSPLLAKRRAIVEKLDRVLSRYRDGIADASRRVLARAARPLIHRGVPVSQVGALLATALLASVPRADAAIFNGGSVRADLPSGQIRYSDLYEAFPFDNRLATVRLTGAQLTQVVEKLLTRHGMPIVAGLRLKLRCGPPRQLVLLLDGRGRPLQPRRLYMVAISDFLLTGGDGLGPLMETVPKARKKIERQTVIRELIARYLERQTAELNSEQNPVVTPARTPLVFEDGPCKSRRRRHAFCQ
jgi:5'-nucleotidase